MWKDHSDTKKVKFRQPISVFSPKKVWKIPLGNPPSGRYVKLLSNSKLSSLHQLLPRLNPTAEMVQQTYGEPNPTMAETGSLINKRSPRPDILQKNPQNLYLLAEARCGQTALNDAIFEVKQTILLIEQLANGMNFL